MSECANLGFTVLFVIGVTWSILVGFVAWLSDATDCERASQLAHLEGYNRRTYVAPKHGSLEAGRTRRLRKLLCVRLWNLLLLRLAGSCMSVRNALPTVPAAGGAWEEIFISGPLV